MEKFKELKSKRALREIIILLGLYWLYSSLRWFVARESPDVPFRNAMEVILLESQLGFFYELAIQRWLLDNAMFMVDAANHFYTVGYFPILIIMGVLLFVYDQKRFDLFRGTFVLGLGLALVGFSLFPLAPPRMLSELGFVDTQLLRGIGVFNQKRALSFYNPYAAMPSMHFGWTVLIGIMLFSFKWRVCKLAAFVYPAMMALTVITTGHHYLLDVMGGGIVVGSAYSIVRYVIYAPRSRSVVTSRPAL